MEQLIQKISAILDWQIASNKRSKRRSSSSMMFAEQHYLKHKISIRSSSQCGFALTSPTFQYVVERLPFSFRKVSEKEISGYIAYLFSVLPISNECLLISFIYLERLI